MKILTLMLAFLQKCGAIINNFIKTIETKIQQMETEVKTDVAGLAKFATLNNLSIDNLGNFTLNVNYAYKDANGNVLNYSDPSKSTAIIQGYGPADPTAPTAQELADQASYNALVTAVSPALKTIIGA